MSHPRESPPQDTDPLPVDGLVICTGRGTHPRVNITAFDAGNAGWTMTRRWDLVAGSRPDAFTLRFRCKRCRRDVRLREDKVLAAFAALRQASGGDECPPLDVSALPC